MSSTDTLSFIKKISSDANVEINGWERRARKRSRLFTDVLNRRPKTMITILYPAGRPLIFSLDLRIYLYTWIYIYLPGLIRFSYSHVYITENLVWRIRVEISERVARTVSTISVDFSLSSSIRSFAGSSSILFSFRYVSSVSLRSSAFLLNRTILVEWTERGIDGPDYRILDKMVFFLHYQGLNRRGGGRIAKAI